MAKSNTKNEVAVTVHDVSKDFVLPHEKVDSIKTALINPFRINRGSELQHALKDISFTINKGEFFGIVGRNGSGKSTLLKIIAGIYQPSSGSVSLNGRLVPFIELGVGFNPELTGKENVYLNGALMGFSNKEVALKYDSIVGFSELERFMDQKLKNYSSGMQVRLAFSVATILADSDILLIDEVLAVGDSAFQKKCYAYFRHLKEEKKTVIFVSHDMNAVQEYCDRAILIEDSQLILSDTAGRIANAYTRMFSEEEADRKDAANTNDGKKRWGNGSVTYDKVVLSKDRIADEAEVTLSITAHCNKTIDGTAIFGFKIKDADGRALMGTNTKIKKHEIVMTKGQSVTVKWDVPVIFSDGNYYIDTVIEAKNYSDTYDYWEDAAHFAIERNEPSSYLINPVITTRVTHEKN